MSLHRERRTYGIEPEVAHEVIFGQAADRLQVDRPYRVNETIDGPVNFRSDSLETAWGQHVNSRKGCSSFHREFLKPVGIAPNEMDTLTPFGNAAENGRTDAARTAVDNCCCHLTFLSCAWSDFTTRRTLRPPSVLGYTFLHWQTSRELHDLGMRTIASVHKASIRSMQDSLNSVIFLQYRPSSTK